MYYFDQGFVKKTRGYQDYQMGFVRKRSFMIEQEPNAVVGVREEAKPGRC